MVSLVEQWLEEGRRDGLQKGLQEGRQEGRQEVAARLLKSGISVQIIIESTGLSPEMLKKIAEQNQSEGK